MTVSYNAALQAQRMDDVIAAFDASVEPATLEIGTAAMAATLVSTPLADPSFSRGGTPPNVALTLLGTPRSANATGTGTAAAARIKNGDGTIVASGLTVGTSSADVILNSLSITTGQQVSISSGTITHSP